MLDMKKEFDTEKDKVRQIMSRIPSRIFLTFNVWKTTTYEGYICLTSHFVDEN